MTSVDEQTSEDVPTKSTSQETDEDWDASDADDDDEQTFRPLSTLPKGKRSKKPKKEKEALYSHGATPLFCAIEDCQWREALDIIEDRPNQIPVWVRFEAEDSAFSGWRRLPIHEACRRQAPAWLISTMLSLYPDCAQKVTHFDQLPLHVAVEFGAAPEVVNLLVVAYWDAIVAQDQSGRTPVELLDTSELLQREEYRVVHESLVRCHQAYTNFQQSALDQQHAIRRKHKMTFAAVTKKHGDELRRERDIQAGLRNDIAELKNQIAALEGQVQQRDSKIHELNAKSREDKTNEQRLKDRIEVLYTDIAREKHRVSLLLNTVEQKDRDIAQRDERIQLLSGDLQAVLHLQETDVASSLAETERTMRAMVSTQIALQKQIIGHSDSLRGLLKERGVAVLPPNTIEGTQEHRQEEKESSFIVEPGIAEQAAVVAAAAAALKNGPLP